jgi:baculoviral IAP repeat-containing protein 7/8
MVDFQREIFRVIFELYNNDETLANFRVYDWSSPRINSLYLTKEDREATFSNWPNQIVQRPDQLAKAGFYYTQRADGVTCYSCGGGLRQWKSHDDPWIEHARHYGDRCNYVQVIKGDLFVRMHFKKPHLLPEQNERTITSVEVVRENLCDKSENESESKSDRNDESDKQNSDSNNCQNCIQCKICLSSEIQIIFIPCGHALCCAGCALTQEKCPYCREKISNGIKVHFT